MASWASVSAAVRWSNRATGLSPRPRVPFTPSHRGCEPTFLSTPAPWVRLHLLDLPGLCPPEVRETTAVARSAVRPSSEVCQAAFTEAGGRRQALLSQGWVLLTFLLVWRQLSTPPSWSDGILAVHRSLLYPALVVPVLFVTAYLKPERGPVGGSRSPVVQHQDLCTRSLPRELSSGVWLSLSCVLGICSVL